MLFSSIGFLFLFLPCVLLSFTVAHKWLGVRAAQWVLLLASCLFYGLWKVEYLALLIAGLVFNFWIGGVLLRSRSPTILFAGIATDLGMLAYFKYADFFIINLNTLLGLNHSLLNVLLPLGISFFIFQKIAYLVDCYRGLVTERDPLRFALFVLFFPQLIAGPIVHHAEIIPQLRRKSLLPDAGMVSAGLFLLATGLFKKVIVADWLGEYVSQPFSHAASLQFLEAWTAALAYALQLYFDFSAYSEMAMGLALLFGIHLPLNFNSPYKSSNIAEFWRRWHMTLGRFLRDYLYIPLGGSHHGARRAALAALIVMVLGGLWHGAGWTFILWGVMHGVYLAVHRLWASRFHMPRPLGMALTFVAVLFAWVMFRAASVPDAISIWKSMLGLNGLVLPPALYATLPSPFVIRYSSFINGLEIWVMLCVLAFTMLAKNAHERLLIDVPTRRSAMYLSAMVLFSILALGHPSTFLYFQF